MGLFVFAPALAALPGVNGVVDFADGGREASFDHPMYADNYSPEPTMRREARRSSLSVSSLAAEATGRLGDGDGGGGSTASLAAMDTRMLDSHRRSLLLVDGDAHTSVSVSIDTSAVYSPGFDSTFQRSSLDDDADEAEPHADAAALASSDDARGAPQATAVTPSS